MILNFGSINIDHVYRVKTLPRPGETLMAESYTQFLGGKGVNQSVAIAKSGGQVRHIGALGPDGAWALERIADLGVATDCIAKVSEASGHAIIYVDDAGENEIVLYGGANQALTESQVAIALADASVTDWVLLQNETNLTKEIVTKAKALALKVAYSPAPFDAEKALAVMDQLDLLAVNEIEASQLEAAYGKPISAWCPTIITKGGQGAAFHQGGRVIEQPIFCVPPLDTTGAGDTFFGAFLANFGRGEPPEAALKYAAAAAAIQVTRPGAATAIPDRAHVIKFIEEQV